jgi:hypothetical protein
MRFEGADGVAATSCGTGEEERVSGLVLCEWHAYLSHFVSSFLGFL